MLLALTPAVAQAQTGAVEGHVFCDNDNGPARGADVHLIPLDSLLKHKGGTEQTHLQSLDSPTDFGGNYVFPSVPAGTYVVYVQEAGYSSEFPLIRDVLGRFTLIQQEKLLAQFPQVTVGGGVAQKNVVIYRGAAIMGHVSVDTGGTLGPSGVTAVMVSSDLLGDMNGGQGQKPVSFSRGGPIDDRGNYRIAGLPAGTYRLQTHSAETYTHISFGKKITVKQTRMGAGTITVFAPGVLKASDAKLVHVGNGDELSGVDITIPLGRLYSIDGTVTQGGNPVRAILQISSQGHYVEGPMGSDMLTMADGNYRFDLLPSGTYTIQAEPIGPNPSHDTAHITVQLIGNSISGVNINLPDSAPTN